MRSDVACFINARFDQAGHWSFQLSTHIVINYELLHRKVSLLNMEKKNTKILLLIKKEKMWRNAFFRIVVAIVIIIT